MTAFLERFFEKYVGYDFTARLEDELDEVSGGRAQWQAVLDAFWRDFKPLTTEVMERKPSEVTAALDTFLEPYLFPRRADGGDPRLCPNCGEGQLALRGGKFGAFVACSNYPECKCTHPETGEEIKAAIGRYGPYLQHAGKYARLTSTADVFETGMNAAVVKLAEAAAGGGRPQRGAQAPLKVLGPHPRTEAELRLMEGRYGPYVTDGTTSATLPKSVEKDALTLEEAAQLIDARAAAAPPAKGKKPAAKKAPAKKTAATKAPAKAAKPAAGGKAAVRKAAKA